MKGAFYTIAVSGLATLFLAAPGLAGDNETCKKGADCCKVTGKPCDTRGGHKGSKEGRHGNRDDRKSKAERRMNKLTTFSFQQSGGFAGISKGYEVNLADLGDKEKDELAQLIEKSGLLKDSGSHITRGAADMFVYTFNANSGDRKYEVTFDDGTLPQSYRPLLAFTKDKLVNLKR